MIVESPEAGLGDDSVELTTETATSDFVGIGRAGLVAGPLSDITGGSWMTYATGDSGLLDAEPASLRFGMFRLGTTEFTTMTVERVYNATVTAGVWQTTTLDDDTLVYQTNTDGDFCLVDPFTPCTFADFKAQYPDAVVLSLQVAIGIRHPGYDLVRRRRVPDRGRRDGHLGLRACGCGPAAHAEASRSVAAVNGRRSAGNRIADVRWLGVHHLRCRDGARAPVGRQAPIASDRLTVRSPGSALEARHSWMRLAPTICDVSISSGGRIRLAGVRRSRGSSIRSGRGGCRSCDDHRPRQWARQQRHALDEGPR